MKIKLFLAALAALACLHQDFWLWRDSRLLLGFLPSGLAYHAGYSLATAGLWLVAVRRFWPSDLDVAAAPRSPGGGRRQ